MTPANLSKKISIFTKSYDSEILRVMTNSTRASPTAIYQSPPNMRMTKLTRVKLMMTAAKFDGQKS